MEQKKQDIAAYKAARSFILKALKNELNKTSCRRKAKDVLDSYLTPTTNAKKNDITINAIYQKILESAQNANMHAGVIGGAINGVGNLRELLSKFNPKETAKKYGEDHSRLLDDIIKKLKPTGQVRRGKRSLWPKYTKTVLSAASFLDQFESDKDFLKWVRRFYDNPKTMAALPLILAEEIKGIGYALACDFLKELGFTNYGKPDVHINKIFKAIGLCPHDASPYQVQKAIVRIAQNNAVTPYHVDKIFWLIGSGYFYKHSFLGKNGRIGRNRDKFTRNFLKAHVKHKKPSR